MIYVSSFQPFPSRIGQDTVIRLQFSYDPDLVESLKKILRHYKDEALDPAKHIFHPGGWIPKHKWWYVERNIWELVKHELEEMGYQSQTVEDQP